MVIVPLARGTAQRVQEVRAGVADTIAKKRLAPLASAIVPGTGQIMLGDNRSIAYVAITSPVAGLTDWNVSRDMPHAGTVGVTA